MKSLGEAGEIEPETEGMLIENGVDFSEFPQEVKFSENFVVFQGVFWLKFCFYTNVKQILYRYSLKL